MDKEQLFSALNLKISAGEITRAEVVQRLGLNQAPSQAVVGDSVVDRHFSVTKMLYVLGAGIVLIGILIFVAQIWDEIGSFGRIVITGGLGFLLAALGSMLYQQAAESKIGSAFHFMGGLLIPFGAFVALTEFDVDSAWAVALTFVVITVFYATLAVLHKHAILSFFVIANGTAALYLLAHAALEPQLAYRDMEIVYQYLTMTIGVSYLFAASSFARGWNARLVNALYFFGITGLLGAAFFRVLDSVVWELFYFLVVFGGLLVSVYLKSRIILVMSTLFLLLHVTYITSEYFANSLGWPIVLVLLGFIFMGLGYASLTINNKYIKKPADTDA